MTGFGFWRQHGEQFNKLWQIKAAIAIAVKKVELSFYGGNLLFCQGFSIHGSTLVYALSLAAVYCGVR